MILKKKFPLSNTNPVHMYIGVTTGFDVSSKDNVGKGPPFDDMSDTEYYGMTRFDTQRHV